MRTIGKNNKKDLNFNNIQNINSEIDCELQSTNLVRDRSRPGVLLPGSRHRGKYAHKKRSIQFPLRKHPLRPQRYHCAVLVQLLCVHQCTTHPHITLPGAPHTCSHRNLHGESSPNVMDRSSENATFSEMMHNTANFTPG